MKKFLAILLFAAISCNLFTDLKQVGFFNEEDEVVLRGLPDFFKRLWDKIVEFWHDIPGAIQKVISFLKDNGYWDTLIDLIKKYGTKYGTDFCDNYLDHDLCADAVKFIFDLLDSLK